MATPYAMTISRVGDALTRTFSEIYPWFEQPEDVRAYKPADGGWSINEVLEHITLTTHYLMIIVRKGWPKAIKRAETQEIKGTDSDLDVLIPIGARGTFRWIRPEHMEPTGKPSADVLTLMRQQETECLEILSKVGRGEGSLFKVRMSVNNLGHIDLYQWLYFVAQHAKRHIGQMNDNRSEFLALSSAAVQLTDQ